MARVRRKVVAAGIAVVLAVTLLGSAALAQGRGSSASQEEDEGHSAIAWVGAVATNLFYIPTKLVYAGLGGFIGLLGFAVTGFDVDAGNGIWVPTVKGNWVVTPAMLEGKEDVHFIGQAESN